MLIWQNELHMLVCCSSHLKLVTYGLACIGVCQTMFAKYQCGNFSIRAHVKKPINWWKNTGQSDETCWFAIPNWWWHKIGCGKVDLNTFTWLSRCRHTTLSSTSWCWQETLFDSVVVCGSSLGRVGPRGCVHDVSDGRSKMFSRRLWQSMAGLVQRNLKIISCEPDCNCNLQVGTLDIIVYDVTGQMVGKCRTPALKTKRSRCPTCRA